MEPLEGGLRGSFPLRDQTVNILPILVSPEMKKINASMLMKQQYHL